MAVTYRGSNYYSYENECSAKSLFPNQLHIMKTDIAILISEISAYDYDSYLDVNRDSKIDIGDIFTIITEERDIPGHRENLNETVSAICSGPRLM